MTQGTITITIDQATAELEAKQKRYDETAAIINAKITAATC